MDNCCSNGSSVAAGIDFRLHDGRNHSYSAGYRHRRGTDPDHPGPKAGVNILSLAG